MTYLVIYLTVAAVSFAVSYCLFAINPRDDDLS
jgi:hypothetical protein